MNDSIDRRLHADATPPPHLARRVEQSLREHGLLRGRPARPRMAAALLLAAACFALGIVAGRWQMREPALPEVDRYVLLLYTDATFTAATAGRDLVGEYREWAGQLRANGRMELGERLDPLEERIGSPGTVSVPESRLTGFFIIRAPSPTAAAAIGRESPHARHGGTVVVRRIAPT